MARIQKILVPVDGSAPSLAALSRAVELAEDLGASVDTLRIATGEPEDDILHGALDAAESKLGGRLRRRTDRGAPGRKIVEIAATERFDLVVMGTHGRVGRLHALIGSVAEEVVRNAPCPVLTVREPDGGEESFAERIHRTASIADQFRPR